MPTFDHQFSTPAGVLSTAPTNLSVQEIEDAGVLEILQSPGATLGHWQFLDALLDPAASSFSFLQQLGHAREVKTAISGLFGRFVARAYATRHLGLTHFTHVRKPPMSLGGPMHGVLQRVHGSVGDMPDWIAWGAGAGMAIVEAKGCHDQKGPQAALDRAYAQANRAEIRVGGRLAPFKRYAIATRWGFTGPKASRPMLWVHDPEESGAVTAEERESLEVAMSRWHIASLLGALGHQALAKSLIALTHVQFQNRIDDETKRARRALSDAMKMRVQGDIEPETALVGGYVSRSGRLESAYIEPAELGTLRKHGLRPSFVGVETSAILQAISGKSPPAPNFDMKRQSDRREGEDGAGSWVIRLSSEQRQVNPLVERS